MILLTLWHLLLGIVSAAYWVGWAGSQHWSTPWLVVTGIVSWLLGTISFVAMCVHFVYCLFWIDPH